MKNRSRSQPATFLPTAANLLAAGASMLVYGEESLSRRPVGGVCDSEERITG
jgi:hypothetical protein